MQETFEQTAADAVTIPTLRRDQGGQTQLVHALAHAFTTGTAIDWTSRFPRDPTRTRSASPPTPSSTSGTGWTRTAGWAT